MTTDDFETCPPGTMKELSRLQSMEARLHETIADYEFLRRSYAETGDHVRAEMFAERIAQLETAMGGEA